MLCLCQRSMYPHVYGCSLSGASGHRALKGLEEKGQKRNTVGQFAGHRLTKLGTRLLWRGVISSLLVSVSATQNQWCSYIVYWHSLLLFVWGRNWASQLLAQITRRYHPRAERYKKPSAVQWWFIRVSRYRSFLSSVNIPTVFVGVDAVGLFLLALAAGDTESGPRSRCTEHIIIYQLRWKSVKIRVLSSKFFFHTIIHVPDGNLFSKDISEYACLGQSDYEKILVDSIQALQSLITSVSCCCSGS